MVLERRWTFYGLPMVLRPWSDSMNLDKLDVTRVPVWIRLPNLPLKLWSPEVLEKIASYIGRLVATDRLTATKLRLEYARVS